MSAPRVLSDLHALARRAARRPDEADDLLQAAILAALESGRTDLAAPDTRRWLAGVIRNRAALDARTAARRRRRETGWCENNRLERGDADSAARLHNGRQAADAVAGLSPALRVTALLALSGHTRQEIGWLLHLSDAALRQRISQLKRSLGGVASIPQGGLEGALAFGRIRRALLAPARRSEAFLASHDPDGHLFVVTCSQTTDPRQHTPG